MSAARGVLSDNMSQLHYYNIFIFNYVSSNFPLIFLSLCKGKRREISYSGIESGQNMVGKIGAEITTKLNQECSLRSV